MKDSFLFVELKATPEVENKLDGINCSSNVTEVKIRDIAIETPKTKHTERKINTEKNRNKDSVSCGTISKSLLYV